VSGEPGYRVREVSWTEAGERLGAIRKRVFVDEQGVSEALEWDGLDPACRHVLAETAGGEAVGTGRLLPDAHIGRMAVLPAWRRRGVGSALLTALIAMARSRGDAGIVLHAQAYVVAFYRRAGFVAIGEPFMEAGIPHVRMELELSQEVRAGR
jgi:predicted GNAT family N-acyltransferase